jgi:molybdenum cofactor cytidylyltransferase
MIVGVLLAAGTATRFGGNKLLAELGNGLCVAEAACATLRPCVDRLVAVVRPGAIELAARLSAAGAEICVYAQADAGMGASLAYGVAQTAQADGWLIALGDMPLVASADALLVATALRSGAAIAVPVAYGRRGHPVGFAHRFFTELTALTRDVGARSILARHSAAIVEVPVSEPDRWHDIDTVADLDAVKQLYWKP